MSNDQFINQKYLQSYKNNCNLEEFYIIIKSFYTKVSRIKRLTLLKHTIILWPIYSLVEYIIDYLVILLNKKL